MKDINLFNAINNLSETQVFARTLYGEARGEVSWAAFHQHQGDVREALQGLVAVGHVIMNRFHAQTWYGKTIKQVCLKPYQFSCWNEQDPNLKCMMSVEEGSLVYQTCLLVAQNVRYGIFHDITDGADHYHARGHRPYWLKYARPTVCVGRHFFYKMRQQF